MNKLKTILYDIETSPNKVFVWNGMYEQNVIEVIEYGKILSFSYKELGRKQVKAYSLDDFNGDEEKFIKKLWEVFNSADILIGHNSDAFDNKWSNRMFVMFDLTPPSQYKSIDTLKVARSKFKMNSNKLDDLGEYLNVGRKIKHEGFSLWKKCMAGDSKAFKDMCKYNKQDVVLLENVYLKLRPFMNNHPIVSIKNDLVCPMCGGNDVHKRGWLYTNVFKKQRVQCQSCGKWFTGEQIRYKDKVNVLK